MVRKLLLVPVVAVVLGLVPIQARAAPMDFDFQGNFAFDNDVVLFGFSVSTPSTVTVFSSSWLSGDGGGFDPMLGIWDSSGNSIAFQDDGHNVGTTLSNGVPYNHGVWDSYFVVPLNPGSYFASVTQFDNFPAGSNLSDGFIHDGNPNFTFDAGFGGATQPYFNGVWDSNDPRTSFWQFHLLNVDQAEVVPPGGPVPEPASITLLALGLAGLGGRRWRQRKAR